MVVTTSLTWKWACHVTDWQLQVESWYLLCQWHAFAILLMNDGIAEFGILAGLGLGRCRYVSVIQREVTCKLLADTQAQLQYQWAAP